MSVSAAPEPRRKRLQVADITVDRSIQVRHGNHADTIERYMDAFDSLPPVDVFETPDGRLLLANGFQREAAAGRLGRTELEANVYVGTRAQAAEFAILANTKNADPLTAAERDAAIVRLHELHPDYTPAEIARQMSIGYQAAWRALKGDEVTSELLASGITIVNPSTAQEIALAQPADWRPLARASKRREDPRAVAAALGPGGNLHHDELLQLAAWLQALVAALALATGERPRVVGAGRRERVP